MNLDQLIEALKKLQDDGYGHIEVRYDGEMWPNIIDTVEYHKGGELRINKPYILLN